MQPNNLFFTTLLISFLLHGVILLQASNFSLFKDTKKEQKTELNYLKVKKEKLPPMYSQRQDFLKLPARITLEKQLPSQHAEERKEIILQNNQKTISYNQQDFNKPVFVKPEINVLKKKISLPPLATDMNKITNPSYISYYQLVREKIRRAAYQNYSRNETGEVYLSFIIANDGSLKGVKIIDAKSSLSAYLKDTALKSIHQAANFPVFPKELDYPQLSFNVIISFEIE